MYPSLIFLTLSLLYLSWFKSGSHTMTSLCSACRVKGNTRYKSQTSILLGHRPHRLLCIPATCTIINQTCNDFCEDEKCKGDTFTLLSIDNTLAPYHIHTHQYTASVNLVWFDHQSKPYLSCSHMFCFSATTSYMIFFCLTGKIWEECKDIWSQDIREYISEPWNLLDFSILAIFMTSFIARLMAFWHAYSAQCYVDKHHTDLSDMTLPFEIRYFQLGEWGPIIQ